eukprot:1159876-Pelagomonas_calceolata.AAC.6
MHACMLCTLNSWEGGQSHPLEFEAARCVQLPGTYKNASAMCGLFVDEEGHILEGPNMNVGIITQ